MVEKNGESTPWKKTHTHTHQVKINHHIGAFEVCPFGMVLEGKPTGKPGTPKKGHSCFALYNPFAPCPQGMVVVGKHFTLLLIVI